MMNKNLRAIYDQVAQECMDECADLNSKEPIPWQWEEKYALAVVTKCLEVIEASRCELPQSVIDTVKSHFGMINGKQVHEEVVGVLASMLKEMASWKDVPKSEWANILYKITDYDMEPIEDGYGTHVNNAVYLINGKKYDLTYENGKPMPFGIKVKL